ncbi:MAG: amidohydrolase family protein [Deltaproteobacteria bacterium]|nr:amidohydrolase family protein [Candidatus Anaeroferrophillus wilburensis]MBN2889957.1 amidohydrolase family protein [Deltaproteobacteria bacterium]
MPGRYLLTAPWVMVAPDNIIAEGAVLIEGNRILAAAPANELTPLTRTGDVHLRRKHSLIMPGLINAHCHLELSGFHHLCPAVGSTDFVSWIIDIISAKKKAAPETFIKGIVHGEELLLDSGTTGVGDLRSPLIFAAPETQTSRLRAVHFLEAIGIDQKQQLERAVQESITAYHPPDPMLTRPGIAPHTPYTVSLFHLRQLLALAGRNNLPTTIHVGESVAETAFFKARKGAIAERLYPFVGWQEIDLPPPTEEDSIDLLLKQKLPHTTSAVHLGNATKQQLQQFIKRIIPVVCLRSNHTLGNPLADLPLMLSLGLKPAMGTDSLTSVSTLSLWDEMRFLAATFPTITGAEILSMATINGAAALGMATETGKLEAGFQADIIAVQIEDSEPLLELKKLIRHTDNNHITMVMVGGRIEKLV